MVSAGYDVIVLGVGAMGSATVYQLGRRGKRVLGLERDELPHAMGPPRPQPHHRPGLRRGPRLGDAAAAVLGAVAEPPGQGGRAAAAQHRVGRCRVVRQLGVQRLAAVRPPARAAPHGADRHGTGRAVPRLPASARDAGVRQPEGGSCSPSAASSPMSPPPRPRRRGPGAGTGAGVAAARRRRPGPHRPRSIRPATWW
jgi:sarcosine oxidase